MDLTSPLSEIARDIYLKYYSQPYPGGLPRTLHGMDHVGRAAAFGTVVHKLMSAQGEEASTELKLIQIALLLHDSARQGDGEDKWDPESAANVYEYLTTQLGVDATLAKNVADMVLNKDQESGKPLSPALERMRLAIQFGDCVDIYRERGSSFDWGYLQFYNQNIDNPTIETIIERMIPECFAFIETNRKEPVNIDTFDNIMSQLSSTPVVGKLLSADKLSESDKQSLLSSGDEITDAFVKTQLLFRGIPHPNELFQRSEARKPKTYPPLFSCADQECLKTGRRSSKIGNPARSFSLVGQGGKVYGGVGGGVLMKRADILAVYPENKNTGFGPKHEHKKRFNNELVQSGLKFIRAKMKSGRGGLIHSEALLNVLQWDCIMVPVDTQDESQGTIAMRFLQAVFLRERYQEYLGQTLPVYSFSSRTGLCQNMDVSDDAIIRAYQACLYSLFDEIMEEEGNIAYSTIQSRDIEYWMKMISGSPNAIPLDHYYHDALKTRLRVSLNQAKLQYLDKNHERIQTEEKENTPKFMKKYRFRRNGSQRERHNQLMMLKLLAEQQVENDTAEFLIEDIFNHIAKGDISEGEIEKLDEISSLSVHYQELITECAQDWLKDRGKDLASLRCADSLYQLLNLAHEKEQTIRSRFHVIMKKAIVSFIDKTMRSPDPRFFSLSQLGLREIVDLMAQEGQIILGEYYDPVFHEKLVSSLETDASFKLGTLFKYKLQNYRYVEAEKLIKHKKIDSALDILQAQIFSNIYDPTARHVVEAVFLDVEHLTHERVHILINIANNPNNQRHAQLIKDTIEDCHEEFQNNPHDIPDEHISNFTALVQGILGKSTKLLVKQTKIH